MKADTLISFIEIQDKRNEEGVTTRLDSTNVFLIKLIEKINKGN